MMSGVDSNSNRVVVEFDSELYDITDFVHKHPGGFQAFTDVHNKNIKKRMLSASPHSDGAIYLLKGYKISSNTNNDDSLEYLVDWTKPMLGQLDKLGTHYTAWINLPIDRPMRLFDSDLLESFTRTKWYLVPLVWLPIIVYLIWHSLINDINNNFDSISKICSDFVSGMCFWTILEYCMHRWLFHINPPEREGLLRVLHFLLHGVHHKVPFDSGRLVFPPVLAAVIALILSGLIKLCMQNSNLFIAGAITGYVGYDLLHYYLHFTNPSISFLCAMKRRHFQHHFHHHDKGFGVTTTLWDNIFNTKLTLHKLKGEQ